MINLAGVVADVTPIPIDEGRTRIVMKVDKVKGIDSPATVRMIMCDAGYAFEVPCVVDKEAIGRKGEYTWYGGNSNGHKPSFCLDIDGMKRYRGEM